MGVKFISPELIVRDNLSENLWRQLMRKLRGLMILFSIVIAGLLLAILYYLKTELILAITISLVVGLLMIISGMMVINLATQPLWNFLNAVFPFSRATKANQLIPFQQAEAEITNQLLSANQSITTLPASPYTVLNESLDRINCGILVIDHFDQIINANNFIRQLLNHDQKLPLIFNNDEPSIDDWIKKSRQKEIHANRIWQGLEFDTANRDQRRWFDVHANFNHNDQNETILLITESLSDQKERQSAFEFTSYAAHELRGPVTIIRGYLDILKTDFPDKTETGRIILERLIVAGNRLSCYINNILNAAKIDQRTFAASLKPTAPHRVIDEIYDDIYLRAKTNQKKLEISIESDLPLINIDIATMTQAVTNLIDNAIKYSKDDKPINISIFRDGDEINFQIKDHGIGMSTGTLRNLFKRFYRSYQRQDHVSGTGIGLFITKAIVEANRGKITVSSKVGIGSTFTISIPLDSSLSSSSSEASINNHGLIRK